MAQQDIEEQTLEDIRSGRMPLREEIAGPQGRRLWDNVDRTWTQPLPAGQVHLFLMKVVYKCSACQETSNRQGQIEPHIAACTERAVEHKNARIRSKLIDREVMQICSGCQVIFQSRKQQGKRHLDRVKAMGPLHASAHQVALKRFAEQSPQQ